VQGNEPHEIVLSPGWFRRVLTGTTALVSVAGLVVEVLKSVYRWKGRTGVVPLLSLSHEQNLPTYYSAVLLVFAAVLSALLAVSPPRANENRRDRLAWWGLCAGFVYISIDEVLELHEHWGSGLHLRGVLHFSWVVPAGCILVVLAALYGRFLLRMPRRTRNRLVLAGAVYVTGAVLLELPLGYWTEREGQKNLEYALIDWVEETLEMAGITLFLFTTLDLLVARGVTVRFGARPATGASGGGTVGIDGPEMEPSAGSATGTRETADDR